MAKTKVSEFDAVASNNTDINSVNVAEGCPPSGINNAIREMASLLKKQEVGTDAMTSPDINGGTIDGATIGGSSGVTIGVSDGTNSAPSIKFTSDTNTGIYRGGTDILKFVTAGTDAITIDASQGVTLAGKLDVSSGTIKLDGNYPVGNGNVALGDQALSDGSLSGDNNIAIGQQALQSNTSGQENVAIGRNAGVSNTTGIRNILIGQSTGNYNTTASNNTAVGYNALNSNTTASNNTAVGYQALFDNTTGGQNTAVGREALSNNTTANSNSALGYQALLANTTGEFNTAIGREALEANTTASENTAVGYGSLTANTTGTPNTAVGYNSQAANTTGTHNASLGSGTLRNSTTGNYNTAIGNLALNSNTTSTNNTAVGYQASYSQTVAGYNTSVGYQAGYSYASGAGNGFNTMIGLQSGYSNTGYQNTFVGHQSGYFVTSGAKNVILGGYNGNQDGVDIRTSSNNIVLSDGDGRALGYYTSSGAFWIFRGNANGYFATRVEQQTTAGSPYGVQIQYTATAPDNQSGQFIRCEDTSANRFIVYNDGDVVNHDNSYGSISDVKLKEQITDVSSQWDDIKALTVRKYKMKSDVAEKGDSDAHWRLGLVAQEVETAGMNGLVKNNPDMIENEDGEMVDSGTTTKSVKYSILYMKAVKALQEAMERIETLEAKVTALENG